MRRLSLSLLVLVAGIHPQMSGAAWIETAAGAAHTCALDDAGNVYCWGSSNNGQLGLGPDSGPRDAPVPVPGLSGVKALAAGRAHTCAVAQQDGSVRCWGANNVGQLGLDVFGSDMPVPKLVAGLVDVVAITAGDSHTCAATADGVTYCWGSNNSGQLGLNDTSDRLKPTVVPALAALDVQSLAAGIRHTCAVTSAGALMCWGGNTYGQLGVGDNVGRTTPTGLSEFADGSGTTTVVAGAYHTCAITAGDKLMCWGLGMFGQLAQADGDTSSSNVPKQAMPGGVARVATGAFHTCAIVDSLLYCSGWNPAGQLGTGDNEMRAKPALIDGHYANALGLTAGYAHTCVLKADESLGCWGANDLGQLGVGLPVSRSGPAVVAYRPGPAAVRDLAVPATQGALSVGISHACALLDDGGGVVCWGSNVEGELGLGDHTDRVFPTGGIALQKPVALAAGGLFTCAVKQDGGVSCWGANYQGQLGNGSLLSASRPVDVHGIDNATSASVGGSHACVVRQGGVVSCWGSNLKGQLGRGTSTDSEPTPSDIPNFGSVSALAAGVTHTCALTTAATVFCWGGNEYGQLGIGTTDSQTTPQQIPSLSDVVSIAAGGYHTCAVRGDGTVWCWGSNTSGELGVGDYADQRSEPTLVPGSMDIAQIAAGTWHTCAVKASGSVLCWGENTEGQLGQGDNYVRWTPVPVPDVAAAVAISTSSSATCVLEQDKSVECWGANYHGQLGSGTLGYIRRPWEFDYIFEDDFDPVGS